MICKSTSESLGFQGISDQLKMSIGRLLDSSKELQSAVIARNVDKVWKILEEQQIQMQEFDRYNYLWKQVIIDSGLDTPQIRQAKDDIRTDLEKLKKAGRSNAILVHSFLAAINRAFKRVGEKMSAKVKIYGKKGKMANSQSSLLINRLG